MTRREIREHLFCMLFRTSFHDASEMKDQYDYYWETQEVQPTPKDRKEIENKLEDVISKGAELDSLIEGNAKGWKLNRIGNADLNILRIAIYEMIYDDSVPLRVAINEAVELAKLYGIDNSPGFINGILANMSKT